MKNFTIVAMSTVLVIWLCNSAKAEDVGAPAAYDWSGTYIGVQGGWAGGNDNIVINSGSFTADLDGFTGGGHVGWNSQVDNVVFGIEADVEWSDMNALIDSDDTEELDLSLMGSVRARVGYTVDNILLYATGGLAAADADFDIFRLATGGREHNDRTFAGYAIGAGAEMGITENASARIEYRYTDLGEKIFPSALFPGDTFHTDASFHSVRLGVSYRF